MRILHFTDLHADPSQIKSMLATCERERPDLLAISGDFTNWTNYPPQDQKLLELAKTFLEDLNKRIPIAFCSGNHETWSIPHFSETFQLLCTDNQSVILETEEETVILTCFPYIDEEKVHLPLLEAETQHLAAYPQATRVWLHHVPPKPPLGNTHGSIPLRALVMKHQPHYVLNGHSHAAPFFQNTAITKIQNTLCCNPGAYHHQHYKHHPPYLRIDTLQKTTEWVKTRPPL